MHVAALTIDLHIPHSRSLKAKRAVVRPLVEGVRRRFAVAVAEVGCHDQWQRAQVGVAAVGASAGHVSEILDAVERHVWATADLEVLDMQRTWVET